MNRIEWVRFDGAKCAGAQGSWNRCGRVMALNGLYLSLRGVGGGGDVGAEYERLFTCLLPFSSRMYVWKSEFGIRSEVRMDEWMGSVRWRGIRPGPYGIGAGG